MAGAASRKGSPSHASRSGAASAHRTATSGSDSAST